METGLSSSDSSKRQQAFADSSCELIVDVPSQTLKFYRDGALVQTYSISTSKYGLGAEEGSQKTPTGTFSISEKIGHDAPLFSVFKSRLPTGEISRQGGEEDLILTRILWLDGRDEDNANTYHRYIYIHGTNQEDQIGTPASHGCIRMRNQDIALLFDQVPVGTSLKIHA